MTSGRVLLSPVAKRYALALVDLATESKVLPKVEKDLDALLALLASSSDFATFVGSPTVSQDQQKAVLSDVAKKAKLQKITENFLYVVAKNARLSELAGFLIAAKAELSVRRGEMTVDVVSAHVLSPAQQKSLRAEVAAVTGKDIVLNASVNSDLIGGMILTIGSQRIDGSVSGRLDRLKAAMSVRVDMNINDNDDNLANKKEA